MEGVPSRLEVLARLVRDAELAALAREWEREAGLPPRATPAWLDALDADLDAWERDNP